MFQRAGRIIHVMSFRQRPSAAFVLVLFAVPSAAWAQNREELAFSPDRPGFSNATGAVDPSHILVESGVGLVGGLSNSFDGVVTLPQALLRVGLISGLELRVGVPSLIVRPDAPRGQESVGGSDLLLGAKLSFEPLFRLPLSAVGEVTIPLQINGFGSSEEATANFNVNLAFVVLPKLQLDFAAFLGFANEEAQASVGARVALLLGPFSPFVQGFFEREAVGGPSAFELNGFGFGLGAAYLLGSSTQLDIFADILPEKSIGGNGDLGTSPTELRAGLGFSFLFI